MTLRSPFFYVGDKYKLVPQLQKLIPQNINKYVEPFVGGGSSLINTNAKQYYANDIDKYVIGLHEYMLTKAYSPQLFFDSIYNLLDTYGFSCSYRGICVSEELKKQFIKTYYSRYNKQSYLLLRDFYNNNQHDFESLYVLLIYGFNHMIRFNSAGKFNLPVGNVDFNKNVYNALIGYFDFVKNHKIYYKNQDYKDFLDNLDLNESDYVFCDPPYLISMSEYNKLWNEDKERELCKMLDELNNKNIRFGITNLIYHKGMSNEIFINWAKKYNSFNIKSNYISFNDNTIKETSKEIFVTNYVQN